MDSTVDGPSVSLGGAAVMDMISMIHSHDVYFGSHLSSWLARHIESRVDCYTFVMFVDSKDLSNENMLLESLE